MKSFLLAILPVASGATLAPRQSYFSFGNYFSTGGVAANSYIRQATTTLVLPALNSPHNGNLALWPGMGTKFDSGADGHLVQGLAISTVGYGCVQIVLQVVRLSQLTCTDLPVISLRPRTSGASLRARMMV